MHTNPQHCTEGKAKARLEKGMSGGSWETEGAHSSLRYTDIFAERLAPVVPDQTRGG
ncbi:hypothetical protein SCLCIDRAFT_1216628 [Scleroderma citrinum Foug A]|uniref:Uncharacterized protein n=1 Tax=Scleroderma citrinum Foug A TaxID=1036808 RepID=A0A0C3DIP0_9AGAM|nr:hypothetical protein SCLCIDRAFT_1216628 [Scleroderma citrinum Foug A]